MFYFGLCWISNTPFRSRLPEDEFLSGPIVPLPPCKKDDVDVAFSSGERILYRYFEESLGGFTQQKVPGNDPGTSLRNFSGAQITRLRQFTAHPILIENTLQVRSDFVRIYAFQSNGTPECFRIRAIGEAKK
jgi:hypothetical protein